MRRSLSILAAAAIALGASVATLSPAIAMPRLAPGATDTTNGAVIQVQGWENFHGDRHNSFRDDGWNDGPRYHRRHHRFRRHQSFHFGFPFAFRPHFYPYNSYRDCFRTWDGQLICRGY